MVLLGHCEALLFLNGNALGIVSWINLNMSSIYQKYAEGKQSLKLLISKSKIFTAYLTVINYFGYLGVFQSVIQYSYSF